MAILVCKNCGYELFPLDTKCDKCGANVNKNGEGVMITPSGRVTQKIVQPINNQEQ